VTDVGLGLTEAELREGLFACLAVPRWVHEVVQQAPYESVADLVRVARGAASPLSAEEIAQALRHHRRLTDRVSPHDPATSYSAAHHSDGSDEAALNAQLTAASQAYEVRFGRIFLIRAAGRPRAELLSELQRRLDNDPGEELREVDRELRDIALLRIPQLFPHLDHHSGYDDSDAAR
jgi:2-oxo-4-hydroxy-4-carboxy-5-ureidoimidazoline decarboxylase